MVAIALVVGAYLGSLFNGFGLGGNGPDAGGETADSATMQDVLADASQGHTRTVSGRKEGAADNDREGPSIAGSLGAGGPVLQVRIDGRSFQVGVREGDDWKYLPAELNAIVAEAQKCAGDEQGIRVRVSRLSSAKASAELMLRDELVKAGVTEDAIEWRDGPRP